MEYYMPTKVIIGDDILSQYTDLFKTLGKKCLIVTGKNSAKVCGALDDFTKILNDLNIEYKIFDGIMQNPLMSTCVEAGRIANEFKAEFIVGIGGGSVLDSSKVIAMVGNNPELDEDTVYAKAWKNKKLPLVLVGLTSGTGSEVTNASVCTTKEGIKKSVSDPLLYGDYAFGDPKYTMSLSHHFTVSTALDALAHSLESYMSKKANDLSRSLSIEAIKMLWPNLEKLKDENVVLSLEERKELYEASIMAGLAINMTATSFGHGVGYYLTENFHLPHGMACAVFMPDIFRHAEGIDKAYVDNFLKRLGKTKDEFLNLVASLLPEFDIKMTEEEIDKVLPRWEENRTVHNTIGDMFTKEIKEILMSKYVS